LLAIRVTCPRLPAFGAFLPEAGFVGCNTNIDGQILTENKSIHSFCPLVPSFQYQILYACIENIHNKGIPATQVNNQNVCMVSLSNKMWRRCIYVNQIFKQNKWKEIKYRSVHKREITFE